MNSKECRRTILTYLEAPLGGQHEHDAKSTACESEANNHDGETPPAPPPRNRRSRRKKTPASTGTIAVGARGNNQEPTDHAINDDHGSTVRGRQEELMKNDSTVDSESERPASWGLCYGNTPEAVRIWRKQVELYSAVKIFSLKKRLDGKDNRSLTIDPEITFDILMECIANVVCCTDELFKSQCSCYDRLKKLIQQGVGESLRLRNMTATPLYYNLGLKKKPNLIVDTPSFLVHRELAVFEEGSEIKNPDSFWKLMHKFLVKIGQEMYKKIMNDVLWTPDLETLADSRYLAANFIITASDATKSETDENDDAAPSIPTCNIPGRVYEYANQIKQIKVANFYDIFSKYFDDPPLSTPTAESSLLIETLLLLTNTAKREPERESVPVEMVEKPSGSPLPSAATAGPSTSPVVDNARKQEPQNSNEAHEVNLVPDGPSSLRQLNGLHRCVCLFSVSRKCSVHSKISGCIDLGKFFTGSILRLMSRRLHSMAETSTTEPHELCHVCQQSLTGGNDTVDPPSYCVACQVKTHAECRSNLFDLCAPAPALSLKNLQRNRYALHEYVNNDFKPRIPALVVHIIVLLTFSHLRAVKGMYRYEQDEKFELLRKRIEDEGERPNLMKMEPLLLGELLKYFLRSLRPRLIGQALFEKLKKCVAHRKSKSRLVVTVELKRALAEESVATRETLLFLIIHLQDIRSNEELRVSAEDLARAFAPVLIDGFTRELNYKYVEVLKKLLQVVRTTWMYLFSNFVAEEKRLPKPGM